MLLTRRSVANMPAARMLHYWVGATFLLLISFGEGTIIRSLIRNNLAGPDLNFKEVNWSFDPDAGRLRSIEYQRINGALGWKAVERVGLGEDGRTEERRRQQQYRDSLGALTYKVTGWDS